MYICIYTIIVPNSSVAGTVTVFLSPLQGSSRISLRGKNLLRQLSVTLWQRELSDFCLLLSKLFGLAFATFCAFLAFLRKLYHYVVIGIVVAVVIEPESDLFPPTELEISLVASTCRGQVENHDVIHVSVLSVGHDALE